MCYFYCWFQEKLHDVSTKIAPAETEPLVFPCSYFTVHFQLVTFTFLFQFSLSFFLLCRFGNKLVTFVGLLIWMFGFWCNSVLLLANRYSKVWYSRTLLAKSARTDQVIVAFSHSTIIPESLPSLQCQHPSLSLICLHQYATCPI